MSLSFWMSVLNLMIVLVVFCIILVFITQNERKKEVVPLKNKNLISGSWTVSVLIPAHNEEKSIEKCITSCLRQTRPPDKIIVVNDGSTDNTLKILKSFGNRIKIVNLEKNTGNKSKAQEVGLKYVDTDIFITVDADTRLDKNFVFQILKSFYEKDIVAVCGMVESEKGNWITKVREINYLIGQTIYKKAQIAISALFVLSGCASGFKTEEFKKIVTFDHDTVTEDLDFTYKLKLANKKLDFNNQAIVYTQDPNNLKSYFKQLYRWYSGGWTCLKKNVKIFSKPNNALMLSLIYVEGFLMGALFLFAPLLVFIGIKYFAYLLLLQFLIVSICLSYGIFKYKKYSLYLYLPHHYFLGLADKSIFVGSFFKEIILNKRNLQWQKADRY